MSGRLVQRGAVQPAMTSDDAWAGALAQEATGAFFGGLSMSAASKLIAAGQTVSLTGRASVRFPRRAGSPEALPWVGQAAPIPVRQAAFDDVTLGPSGKLAVILTLSEELAQASDGEEIFMQLLREDAALSLDAAVFSDDPATDDHVAGFLNGIIPIVAATGGGLGAMQADLAALVGRRPRRSMRAVEEGREGGYATSYRRGRASP